MVTLPRVAPSFLEDVWVKPGDGHVPAAPGRGVRQGTQLLQQRVQFAPQCAGLVARCCASSAWRTPSASTGVPSPGTVAAHSGSKGMRAGGEVARGVLAVSRWRLALQAPVPHVAADQVAVGHLVVPGVAVRDEDTFYHYLPQPARLWPGPRRWWLSSGC